MIFLYNKKLLVAKKTGFTLIELLIVLVILGLSASLIVPDMYGMLKRSQAKTEIAKIKALATLSVERSFFGRATLELKFAGSRLEIKQLATDDGDTNYAEDVDDVDDVDDVEDVEDAEDIENNLARDLKELNSSYFVFAETTIKIVNGEWEGDKIVTLTASPDPQLTQLRLRD